MTLTYRIHSFDPTRNAVRRIHRACRRITENESNERASVSASYSHREQIMTLLLAEDECAERNPDLNERKACIREASRALKDIMLNAGLTFTADLI